MISGPCSSRMGEHWENCFSCPLTLFPARCPASRLALASLPLWNGLSTFPAPPTPQEPCADGRGGRRVWTRCRPEGNLPNLVLTGHGPASSEEFCRSRYSVWLPAQVWCWFLENSHSDCYILVQNIVPCGSNYSGLGVSLLTLNSVDVVEGLI